MVNMENYEEYMTMYADRELDTNQEKALLSFVAEHPELKDELEAYTATRLIPDTAVVFAGKDELLKTTGTTMRLGNWKTYAAAAVMVFGVVLFLMVQKGDETNISTQPIANNQPVTKPKQEIKQVVDQTDNKKDEQKELHSKPVNAIAVETNNTHQPKPTATNVGTDTRKPEEQLPIMPTAPLRAEAGVKELVAENVPTVGLPEFSKPTVDAEKNNFIVNAVEKKIPSVKPVEEALNEKLMVARAFTESVKDTDVTFKLGKKELFTVRF